MKSCSHFFILFSILFLLQSCSEGTATIEKGATIDQSLREEIELLDKKIMFAGHTNNPTILYSFTSKKLLKSDEEVRHTVHKIASVIENLEYRVLGQFHFKNINEGEVNTVMFGENEQNNFTLNYKAKHKETFVSLLLCNVGSDELLITCVYEKNQDAWKLYLFEFGQYKLKGMTAPELYLKAQETYKKGHLMDAANIMFLSQKIAQPTKDIWTYEKNEEINQFYKKVVAESKAKYSFPMVVSELNSRPEIFNVIPQVFDEGYAPAIEYQTHFSLDDTLNTQKENEALHELIGNKFKGINKDKDYVVYRAYNIKPDDKTKTPSYGFVKKVK